MPTLLRERPRAARPTKGQGGDNHRVCQTAIEGRYIPIKVHQLAIAHWLYTAGHISRQQYRVYFAAQEMLERRRYTQQTPGQPLKRAQYTLEEIRSFIGGPKTDSAYAALSTDVKKLGRLGLVIIDNHTIDFATSIDQIRVEDVTGFWDFFEQLPNNRRTVPVPRRTCRALAGSLNPSVMTLMIALMIRTLYWHRPGGRAGEQGGYAIDGRMKAAWAAEVFGLSERAVSSARATLIEMGWVQVLEAPQWQLNKWGQRYQLNPDWSSKTSGANAGPRGQKSGKNADPCLNNSSSPKGESLNTRKPAPYAGAGTASADSREKKDQSDRRSLPPKLHNIRTEDLRDIGRLKELHQQAVESGHPIRGEKGWLDFVCLAQRAMDHGDDAPRLFVWLLKNTKFEFITQAEEDAAVARINAWKRQDSRRKGQGGERRSNPRNETFRGAGSQAQSMQHEETFVKSLGEDERFVHVCLRSAKGSGFSPFRIAQAGEGWTRDRWDLAYASYTVKEKRRWHSDELTFTPAFVKLMAEDDADSGQSGRAGG